MKPKHTNKLAGEKSPYLLQHQHNPVQWLPWGEEAFEHARREDKPIFLSIGYSTCHWCHVMERESFENEEIAAFLNQHFVSIKVDREERPDVDRVYMTYVQAISGHGGWPMSVFLTPDLKPFYGGTYFPPEDRYGRPGFATLLKHLVDAWGEDRKGIEESGQDVIQQLQEYAQTNQSSTQLNWDKIWENGYRSFAGVYDGRWGGFGDAPKFPRPVVHDFLHRFGARKSTEQSGQLALQMSRHTLGAMSDGGMSDQLGGGFHRYSVDEQWIVSHFEKMLYDQAQLAVSLGEMYQMTREERFANTLRATLDYVLRDMTHENGGFYSAEDADSLADESSTHKEEGAFYVWTAKEWEEVLGPELGALAGYFYGVLPAGNAPPQGDPHGEFRGKNILYLARDANEVSRRVQMPLEEIAKQIGEARQKLIERRNTRPRPHRDDKIIASWNGLMISAFARAAQILNEPIYAQAATRALDFIRSELWDVENQKLRRHWKEGAADVNAFADDYAALARASLDVFETTFETKYLEFAEALLQTLHQNFWDEKSGGYFAAENDPHVLLRLKDDYDGAEPSANSLAAEALLRLHRVLEEEKYRTRAEKIFKAFGVRLSDAPSSMPALLAASFWAQTPPVHIVIVGEENSEATKAMLRAVQEIFVPFKTVIQLNEKNRDYLGRRLPFTSAMKTEDGTATAYVCQDFACGQPVKDVEKLRAALRS